MGSVKSVRQTLTIIDFMIFFSLTTFWLQAANRAIAMLYNEMSDLDNITWALFGKLMGRLLNV